jgi:hypothetical protein
MELGIALLGPTEKICKDAKNVSANLRDLLKYGLRYISFEDDFPLEECKECKKLNLSPIITWELYFPTIDGYNRRECSKEETRLNELLEGDFDDYIDEFAVKAKQWKNTVYLRPLHEFNADWYVWSGKKNGGRDGGPELVKKCWKYLVDRFREQNADNVKWIWCVHEPSSHVSREAWNNIKNYWPGDDYVDMTGIDGFNFYPENPERRNPKFHDFDSLFSKTYKQITSLSCKPVFIMTGTSEFSHEGDISSKAEWIEDAFEKISNDYTQINIICWFHFKYNENINWRIDSSEESLNVFKKQLIKQS